MIISSKVFGEKVLISRDSLRVIQGLFLLAVVYPLVSLPPSLPHFKALIKPISLIIGLTPDLLLANSPGGGDSRTRGYWGCAPGWGRIFTTGVTIMGSCFQ